MFPGVDKMIMRVVYELYQGRLEQHHLQGTALCNHSLACSGNGDRELRVQDASALKSITLHLSHGSP